MNKPKHDSHKKWIMFPGRWQPLHEGHMYLIDQALAEGKNVWIAIRDTKHSEKNPFTTKQRFEMIKRETELDLGKAKYFAGHSLGEYTALTASGSLDFDQAIRLLKIRGNAMQSAVPKDEGGMLAVLGTEIKNIYDLLQENEKKYECFIANDNSNGQVVLSGRNKDLGLLVEDLKKKSIKNIKLPVSSPFHCKLMSSATEIMRKEISNTEFKNPNNVIISNVTGKETNNSNRIKDLLIEQIESPVRWRESIIYMINKEVRKFIEIGPGKVLSGLIKRIDKSVNLISVNEIEDLKNIN